jgi:uncharacterized membrane protein YphA (DoxX/SURF4 family)
MNLRRALAHSPQRLATGAYIVHSGMGKWKGSPQQAEYVHGSASSAFPFLRDIPPDRFLKALAVAEMVTGAMLLVPFVPDRVAGAALTGFSGALVTMYLRTPDLHQPGSVWPTPAGMAVSKDVWMLGIGAGLLLDSLVTDRGRETQAGL